MQPIIISDVDGEVEKRKIYQKISGQYFMGRMGMIISRMDMEGVQECIKYHSINLDVAKEVISRMGEKWKSS